MRLEVNAYFVMLLLLASMLEGLKGFASAQPIEVVGGGEVEYRPQVPTYSVSREVPIFISRSVRRTAKDIRVAPFN